MRLLTACSLLLVITISSLSAKTIYVAKNGDDANPGSFEAPFATLAKGSSQLMAGDSLLIREGRYEETLQISRSGTSGNPIVIMPYQGERVVITALESLTGWEADEGSVYKTTVGWDLGQRNFVMYGDTACDLARWPNNTDGDLFSLNSLRNSGGSGADVIYNAYMDYNPGIPDYDWSKGGSVFFYGDSPGSGWIAWKAFIKSNTTTRLTFDLVKSPDWIRTWHAPADLGDFYLEGIREVLDYENEWYFDQDSKVLYLQLPGGKMPEDHEVYMRKRTYTINLGSQDYIVIRNLEVFGGSIEVKGDNNYLYGIKSRWGNHHRGIINQGFSAGAQSLLMGGRYNVVEKCDIGYGAATGVKLSGTGNKLLNSYIHNFNFLGSYDAPVMARDGYACTLSHCTVTRGGRDAVHMSNNNSVMSYNDVSRSNMIADDCALFYCTSGPHNITIHHNWFHDTWGRGKLKKAAGIYLDSSPKGFTVHHNVIWNTEWSSIQMNKDARDINIFNNTLWDGSTAIGTWHAEGTHFERVVVYNNLANNHGWDSQTDYQNNLTVSTDPFVNSEEKNWQLKADTEPVDYGRLITGFTDGFLGRSPDAGAYEHGAISWKAGIDWDPELGPDICLGEGIFEEVEGMLLIEAGSVPLDSTITSCQVNINNPGTYRFIMHAKNGSARVNISCDDFFGLSDGNKVTIDTSFAFMHAPDAENWTWDCPGEFNDTGSMEIYAAFEYSGIYDIHIGRETEGLQLDRLALYQEGREEIVKDPGSVESPTACEEYTIPDPWATPSQVNIFFTEEEINIDGSMEAAWEEQTELVTRYAFEEQAPGEADLACKFRLTFNDTALFIFCKVEDEAHVTGHVDVFMNPDYGHQALGLYGDDAIHLRLFYDVQDSVFVGNGSWKAADYSGLHIVSLETAGGYELEARIPWEGIHPFVFPNVSTTNTGFELDLGGFVWANNTGVDMAMYDTRKFGTLSLKKDKVHIPVAVTGIHIVPDTLVLDPGETVRLTANVLPENADNQSHTWSVEDPYVIDLNASSGIAQGRYPGTTVLVAITEEGGFTDSSIVIVVDPNATGIDIRDFDRRKPILEPNPASEMFRVNGEEQWSELKIFSISGELMLHMEHLNPGQPVSVNDLPSGLYLVRILDAERVYLRKLVKN